MKRIVVFILLSLAMTTHLSAQELYFRHVNIDKGAALSSAISICQDEYGRIWFGNDYLNVYDGTQVRSFLPSSYLRGIDNNSVQMLCSDGKEHLYFVSDNQLIIFNTRTEQFLHGGVNARVLHCVEGELYYSFENRIYHYSEQAALPLYTLPDESATIKSLAFTGEDWLVGTNTALYRVESRGDTELLLEENITCLFQEADGSLWAGTQANGVFLLRAGEWHPFSEETARPLIGSQIRCINQDENGNIWIGTFSGISVVDADLNIRYNLSYNELEPWSLRHSSVYAICRDRQGGMWIGTYYGGMSYFNPDSERFTYYNTAVEDVSKLNGFLFGKMTEDDKGNIYIAAEYGGLNSIHKASGRVKRYDVGPCPIPCQTAKSVWYDKEQDCLYIGTFQRGLLSYDPKSERFESLCDELLTTDNQRIISDLIPWREGLILVTQGGLYLFDRKTRELSSLVPEEIQQHYAQAVIRSAYLDQEERLWLAPAKNEICYIQLSTMTEHRVSLLNSAIGKKVVSHIDSDGEGNLYFTAVGSGLYRYHVEDDRLDHFNEEDGLLLTNQSLKVVPLPNQILLVVSAQGFTRLDLKSHTASFTLLKEVSPMKAINGHCGAYYSPEDSTVFVGGIGGVLSFSKQGLAIPSRSNRYLLSSLSVNNIPVTPASDPEILTEGLFSTKQLVLPHNKNNVTIGFSSTNYRYAEKRMSEYKLEGFDHQWTQTPQRQITYTSLPPGKYRLLIRSVGGNNLTELFIRIKPPFYASSWAWLTYCLLLFLFLLWLYRFNRSRMLLKESLMNEQREKQQLEELNQMKLKFYVNISHELRTPLTLMIGQLELMMQNSALTTGLRNKMQRIRKNASRMQQLITEVLDLRRMEQGKMPLQVSPCDLVGFTREIYDSFHDHARYQQINYRFLCAQTSLTVWFDPVQIQKALNNILSNAFKFTPKGGEVTLQLHKRADCVEIHISDTGCGIAASEQEYIFDRFYQAANMQSNAATGTGIGLALTRDIIQLHKGNIRIESEQGKGSLFILSLRLGSSHFSDEQKNKREIETSLLFPEKGLVAPEALDVATEEGRQEERSISVLLVEDNEELLELLEEAFSPMYRVYKAHDGEQGLEMTIEYMPDIVISDVMMPKMSGIEMCRQIKQHPESSHIPVILLTARTEEEAVDEAMRSRANDYLMKPVRIELLLMKCNNLIFNLRELQRRFSTEPQTTPIELATNKLDQQLLEQSIRIIEENLENEAFNIDMWCREIAIGRTRLANKIKGISGLTLNDFILQIKLRRCALLLKDPALTITEVACRCGFSGPGYLGKCFKEHYGMTPMQYRNAE